MRKCFLVVAAFLLMAELLSAQGFRSFSGRNHPEIRWMQHETEHFSIVMPDRLDYLKHEAATIAELTYEALSVNTGVTFKEKIRIYLSDEDEIANGFAVPFGSGYTNIWVNVNEAATIFTGDVKWLRKVLAHELAHVFHFQATRSNIGIWGFVFAKPMPRFWSEGWAQLQTEKWDSERGDRWIRKAVFEDRLSYDDADALDNSRLVYATGNAQLRYFYDNYGDSAFRAISAARHTTFGIIRTNSFYSAFKKVTGSSYAEFSERWRNHVNIYYNTLAAQMQREDSLGKPLPFPKRSFFLDARFKPGSTDTLAVLRLKSLEHPVKLLELRWTTQKPAKGKKKAKTVYHHRVLAEGDIQEGFNWSPDGKHIAFVRNGPDKNGSLVFDLFTVNIRSGKEKQLTKGARVSYPAWRDSHTIILVKTEGRTANLITFDVQSRESKQVTAFSGDVQLYHTAVSLDGKSVAVGYFGPDGKRAIALVAPDGSVKMLGSGHDDERSLRFSPDGAFVYATSLRDRVPNVFRYRVSDGAQERLTAQFTGASLLDVSPGGDSLLVTVSETRSQDRVYRVPARSRAEPVMPALPDAYTRWMTAGPEKRIPYHPETDTTRILATKKYRSLPNLTHMLSFGFPVFDNNGLNIFAFTQWADPLSHHQVFAAGNWASQSYDDTFYIFSYLNNTLRPSIGASLFKFPSVGQFYGGSYILNYLTGGEISVTMPVDIFHRPYATSFLSARLRSAGFEPSRVKIYDDPAEIGTFAPEALRQTDLLLSFKWVKRHPTRSLVQPRLAYGFQTQITAGTKALGGETAFIRPEAAVFANLPTFGRQAVYMYARGVLQSGKPLAQDFVGLSRYDNLQLDLPVQTAGIVFLSTADRVRGHRQFIIGNRAAFASTEYRVPLLPGLATTVLGVFSFQEVALALFADAGWVGGVQNLPGQTSKMLTGAGYEFKNAFSLGGFRINHAVGVGYRNAVFTKNRADWHYRIRASIPF